MNKSPLREAMAAFAKKTETFRVNGQLFLQYGMPDDGAIILFYNRSTKNFTGVRFAPDLESRTYNARTIKQVINELKEN